MILIKYLRRTFALIPDRSSRFFGLTITLNPSLPIYDTILDDHSKLVYKGESDGMILLALRSKSGQTFEYIFQSPNYIYAYDFVKQSPFYRYNLIDKYLIDELYLKRKSKNKYLAPSYLRE